MRVCLLFVKPEGFKCSAGSATSARWQPSGIAQLKQLRTPLQASTLWQEEEHHAERARLLGDGKGVRHDCGAECELLLLQALPDADRMRLAGLQVLGNGLGSGAQACLHVVRDL